MLSEFEYLPKLEKLPIVSAGDFQMIATTPTKSGGLGNIYKVRTGSKFVSGFYRQTPYLIKALRGRLTDSEKLDYFENLEAIWRALGPNRHHFASRIALPLAIVESEAQKPVGFVMKEYKEGCTTSLEGLAGPFEALQEFKLFLNSPDERLRFGTPHLERLEIFKLIGDFLETLAQLHARNITVGDISASNLVVQKTDSRIRCVFLDIDSFGFSEKPHPLGLQTSPLYRAPEEIAGDTRRATLASDTYKAVLLCIRLLAQVTPFNKDSFSIYDALISRTVIQEFGGDTMYTLIQRALSNDPSERPTVSLISKLWNEELEFETDSLVLN